MTDWMKPITHLFSALFNHVRTTLINELDDFLF